LPDDWLVPPEAEGAKGLQDVIRCAGYGSRQVDVFDAYQPFPGVSAGVEIAGKCRYQ
jgi:hypothetical protein